jgi:hypothetical protein
MLESFSICGHYDLTDCTDKDQGQLISVYLQHSQSQIVDEYLCRMHDSFEDQLDRPMIPLPTTCACKLIEDPV